MANATIKNIETITIKGAAAVTADVSGSNITGLETLNVTKATQTANTTAVSVTAAATTDVNVSGVTLAKNATATNLIDITGGKTVTVNQTVSDAFSRIDVDKAVNVNVTATGLVDNGGSAINAVNVTASTGTVDVTTSGAKIVGGASAATVLNNVTVNGGTVINVTQKATADMGDIATTATANDKVTQGAVTIAATAATTDVTVKQDAAQTGKVAAFTTGARTETASVKFGALKTGDTLAIDTDGDGTGDLTITAKTDMSATEVAAAFANLAANAALPTGAAGDTQSAAAYTKGTYTGVFTGWTSAAASGDTVVFTSNTANSNESDIAFVLTNTSTKSVAPIVTTTDGKGHDATMAGGELAIAAGVVNITANTALTTVTVDGYSVAGSKINGTAAALATINLKNGGAFTVDDTADTVTLTLEKVTGATTFTAEPKTLNVKSIGDNTGVIATANTTAFNVSGTGTLTQSAVLTKVKNITVTETAGLNLIGATAALESIDATATTGAVTVSISGTQTTYAGSKGVDTVTVSNADTAITEAIDLGAGNDKLILSGTGTVKVPTATLKGGEGTDTLSIDATSAALLDDNTLFAAKLSGFERLELTAVTGGETIDLKNLGFQSYVTVAGSGATTALSNLANNATVVISATVSAGITTTLEDAAGEADVLNVEITNASATSFGTLTTNEIETVNLTATGATHTMTFTSDTTTALNVTGTGGLDLKLTNADKLVTIDASKMTEGGLEVTANGKNAMTITGGAGDDVLKASVGATAKADILVGGAGNDTLYAGSNGAKLTGGAGNDLFILTADSVTSGTKNALTATEITDFKAGDLLQLSFYNGTAGNVVNTFDNAFNVASTKVGGVVSFAKLTAVMNPTESTLNDYITAAITQAKLGEAVWFTKGTDSYIVIDSGTESATAFADTEDMVIQLTGVSLTNASFNAEFATVSL